MRPWLTLRVPALRALAPEDVAARLAYAQTARHATVELSPARRLARHRPPAAIRPRRAGMRGLDGHARIRPSSPREARRLRDPHRPRRAGAGDEGWRERIPPCRPPPGRGLRPGPARLPRGLPGPAGRARPRRDRGPAVPLRAAPDLDWRPADHPRQRGRPRRHAAGHPGRHRPPAASPRPRRLARRALPSGAQRARGRDHALRPAPQRRDGLRPRRRRQPHPHHGGRGRRAIDAARANSSTRLSSSRASRAPARRSAA